MTESAYLQAQIKALDEAIMTGLRARKTAKSLRGFFPSQDKEAGELAGGSFSQDTLKYFDANNAFRELQTLQIQLGEMKKQLIDIKIANDRLLYEGGYLLFIDQAISSIFLKPTLCKLKAQDANAPKIIDVTIEEMQILQDRLKAMLRASEKAAVEE